MREQDLVPILINKMFKIAGHPEVTYDKVKSMGGVPWYSQWTWTEKQEDKWKMWATSYLKKKMHWTARTIKNELSWFCLMYSLKYRE